MGFTVSARPEQPIGRSSRSKTGLNDALKETLSTGTAISVPLNGEPYVIVRNRIFSSGYIAARKVDARCRIVKSADGLSALAWFEPIATIK